MAEALLFASAEPVTEKALADRLPDGTDISAVLGQLRAEYAMRGVNLVRVGDAWAFRTAADLSLLLNRDQVQQKKLSRAALEVLAIIAYHQPVTRAEMEDIRGVETAKGTLDLSDGDRLDQDPGPPQIAGPSGDLWHDGRVPRPFRP